MDEAEASSSAWLNNVYFGSSAYGIEAASEIYFSKHASELSLKEAALLAGLPQAPSLYDPLVDPHGRDRSGATRCCRSMLETGAINAYQYRHGRQGPRARTCGPGSCTRRSASRTSSTT